MVRGPLMPRKGWGLILRTLIPHPRPDPPLEAEGESFVVALTLVAAPQAERDCSHLKVTVT
jgi:hypothetical protein